MNGYIGHTDHGWWSFLLGRPEIREVNFWRPGGRTFAALLPGEPFFFRLKSPINRIGGFGFFSRYSALPMWRAWEVFGPANGVADELEFHDRLNRLAKRQVDFSTSIGCIAVADCTFFPPDQWLDVPSSFNHQNLSGSKISLEEPEGRSLWRQCLDLAAALPKPSAWLIEALDRERHGRPQLVLPRLGQGSFRIAVVDAYAGACAITGEHTLPAIEAAHIRPFARGGSHDVQNGLTLRRDIHRLFDLGYVSFRPNGEFLVSPRLNEEFSNGRTYYALAGTRLRDPIHAQSKPDRDLLDWHSNEVYRAS